MARLNARSVKSRQNSVLRYVASTDIDKTASDLNVSAKSLNSFLRAKPETIRKHPERYNKLLSADAKSVAREQNVKLVPNLRGKRLADAFNRRDMPGADTQRINRSIRLAQVTREKRKVTEDGKTFYKPLKETRVKASREHILNNMAGFSQNTIGSLYASGDITAAEAKELMRKLYRDSGLSNAQADAAWRKIKG